MEILIVIIGVVYLIYKFTSEGEYGCIGAVFAGAGIIAIIYMSFSIVPKPWSDLVFFISLCLAIWLCFKAAEYLLSDKKKDKYVAEAYLRMRMCGYNVRKTDVEHLYDNKELLSIENNGGYFGSVRNNDMQQMMNPEKPIAQSPHQRNSHTLEECYYYIYSSYYKNVNNGVKKLDNGTFASIYGFSVNDAPLPSSKYSFGDREQAVIVMYLKNRYGLTVPKTNIILNKFLTPTSYMERVDEIIGNRVREHYQKEHPKLAGDKLRDKLNEDICSIRYEDGSFRYAYISHNANDSTVRCRDLLLKKIYQFPYSIYCDRVFINFSKDKEVAGI